MVDVQTRFSKIHPAAAAASLFRQAPLVLVWKINP